MASGTVSAFATQSDSEFSCLQPAGLSTSSVTSDGITLTWRKLDGTSQYDVRRAGVATVTVLPRATHFRFSGLSADTSYTLELRARSWRGASDWVTYSGRTSKAHTQQPTLSIAAGHSPITEGDSARFTITSDRAEASALSVAVRVSESGSMLGGALPTSVILAANQRSVSFAVTTLNDSIDEPNSVVRASIQNGNSYSLGSATVASVVVQDNDAAPPPPPTCDDEGKPSASDAVTSTETGKETHTNRLAERKRERTVTQQRTRSVECVQGEWKVGLWTNDGDPTYGTWSPTEEWSCISTPNKPADETRTITLSTSTAWEVADDTARYIRTEVTQAQVRTHSWPGATACLWQPGEWTNVGKPVTTRTILKTSVALPAETVNVDSAHYETGLTRVIRVSETPICLEQSQKQMAYTTTVYHHRYVWDGTSWTKVEQQITPPVRLTYWLDVGGQRLCSLRVEGDEPTPVLVAVGFSQRFSTGTHELQWGAERLRFTVPPDAEIRIQSRVLDSGEIAAVFIAPTDAELVVIVGQIGERTPTTADPTLSQVAASLQLVSPPAAPEPGGGVSCGSVAESEAASLNLNELNCATTPGQAVAVTLSDYTITLTLPTSHTWLLMAAPAPDGSGSAAVWLADLDGGSLLALDPASGAELGRVTASGATEIAAVFDAIVRLAAR